MAHIQSNDGPLRELALFAGAGGGILGGQRIGWRTVCAVEFNTYAASVLVARQNDGLLEPFPIWDDVRTFDGHGWNGRVDIISGGFPCQDISAAGKGAGIDGSRSGLWREMARIVSEVRPRFVFVENSPLLVQRGLAVVLGDLAKMGFDAKWGIVSAENAGLAHKRERIWIYAYHPENHDIRRGISDRCREREGIDGRLCPKDGENWESWLGALAAMDVVSRVRSYSEGRRIFYGVANGVDRFSAIGNGQVPDVIGLALDHLTE